MDKEEIYKKIVARREVYPKLQHMHSPFGEETRTPWEERKFAAEAMNALLIDFGFDVSIED